MKIGGLNYKYQMAEIQEKSGGGKQRPGVKKGKKLSTRIDLTPMVDSFVRHLKLFPFHLQKKYISYAVAGILCVLALVQLVRNLF